MKQKKSNFKLMLVLVSGAVLISSFFLLKSRNASSSVPADNVMIMTARVKMDEGTMLHLSAIEWKEAGQGQITPDTITKAQKNVIHDLEDAVVKIPIEKGEVIKLSHIIKTGGKSALSTIIQQGKRAVPVPFSKIANPPALISPGDVVDIILPKKTKEQGNSGGFVGQTILKGLRVLAVDTALQVADTEANVSGAKNTNRSITLEVDAEQAEDLGASIRDGQIIVSMHSIFNQGEDNSVIKTKEIQPVSSESANRVIKVTRGTESKDVTVKN